MFFRNSSSSSSNNNNSNKPEDDDNRRSSSTSTTTATSAGQHHHQHPTSDNSTVLLIKEGHWQSLNVIKQTGQLFLCQTTDSPTSHHHTQTPSSSASPPIPAPKYEIIYKPLGNHKIFSLCRMPTGGHHHHHQLEAAALDRFEVLCRISSVMFQPVGDNGGGGGGGGSGLTGSGSGPSTYAITTAFQKVVTTAVEHPGWRAVHIAAYNGYVDFFHKATLTQAEVDAQRQPDLCTALHLTVLQGFSLTLEALLTNFTPTISLLDCEGNSVLHYAALSTVEILERVLKLPGCELLHRRNARHWSPVELAVFNPKKKKTANLKAMMGHGVPVAALSLVATPGRPLEERDEAFLKSLENSSSSSLAVFSKEDLEQLDLTASTDDSGCPLHWATGTRVVEKLLKDGFAVDTPSVTGETPLAVAVKNGRPKVVLALLINGADPNRGAERKSGASPMHVAIRTGNAYLLKTLLVFDGDPNAVDAEGVSLRHLAATLSGAKEMLAMLVAIGARRCPPNETRSSPKCPEGCLSVEAKEDESSPSPKSTSSTADETYPLNFSPLHPVLVEEILKEDRKRGGSKVVQNQEGQDGSKQPVMMICFDGGGIKGLFTVQMMIELSKYLKVPKLTTEKSPLNFGDYFDWIGGTSTGAMIACALTKGTPLAVVRKLYFTFKDDILTGSRPYDETKLEALFASEMDGSQRMADVLSRYQKHLILMATRVDRMPPLLTLFRSYSYPPGEAPDQESFKKGKEEEEDSSNNFPAPQSTSLWRALRASSAAPTYFTAAPPYIDGGMLANNPTLDMLTEYYRYQAALERSAYRKSFTFSSSSSSKVLKTSSQESPTALKLLLSFGNGQMRRTVAPPAQPELYDRLYSLLSFRSLLRDFRALSACSELVGQVKSIVTNCSDHIVWRADSWAAATGAAFFRLNPLLSKKIALNETDDGELMNGLWEVKVYAVERAAELKQLAAVMDALYRMKMKKEKEEVKAKDEEEGAGSCSV